MCNGGVGPNPFSQAEHSQTLLLPAPHSCVPHTGPPWKLLSPDSALFHSSSSLFLSLGPKVHQKDGNYCVELLSCERILLICLPWSRAPLVGKHETAGSQGPSSFLIFYLTWWVTTMYVWGAKWCFDRWVHFAFVCTILVNEKFFLLAHYLNWSPECLAAS